MTCHNLMRCVTQLHSVDIFFSMIFNRARFSLFSTWSITHLFLAMEFLPLRLPWASVLFAMIVCIAIRFQGKRWVFISVAILESPQTVLFSTTHSICVKKNTICQLFPFWLINYVHCPLVVVPTIYQYFLLFLGGPRQWFCDVYWRFQVVLPCKFSWLKNDQWNGFYSCLTVSFDGFNSHSD